MNNPLTNWIRGAFGGNPRKRTLRDACVTQEVSVRCDMLEERVVLDASLPNLSNTQFIGGQDMYIALPGTDSNNSPITYTASSANANVSATILTSGRSIRMTVSGKDVNGQDFSGVLTFRLFEDLSPETTSRIITLVQQGFYNGLDFHRILNGFVAQGGDPLGNGSGGSGTKIKDEFNKTTTHKSLPADAADATLARIARLDNASEGEYAQDVANDIRATMQQHAGVFRTQAIMDEGVRKIAALRERVKNIGLKDKSKIFNTARIEALEVENLIEAAEATIVSAAARHESRGAHSVDDYGDTTEHPNGRNDTDWHKHTLWHSQGNRLSYKPVQMKPLTVDSIPLTVRSF